MNSELPFLSVLVPCRNEVRFIRGCLESILANDYPAERMEVLVIDGQSVDGTREAIDALAAHAEKKGRARLRHISNPELTAPHALNLGIREAKGDVIARVDAHAAVARDYFSRCVAHLEASGAGNVGGVMRTLPQHDGLWAGPILAALSHRFGVGNSHFRIGSTEPVWVDTVFGGCWRKEVISRVGEFNPQLRRSQDMEFSRRLQAAGFKTLLAPDVHCDYYARSRPGEFLRHNFLNGEWAVLPFLFSSVMPVSLRHLVPLVFVLGVTAATVLTPLTPLPLELLSAAYLTCAFAAAAQIAWRKRKPSYLAAMPLIFALLHLSYGAGSCWGLLEAAKVLLYRRFRPNPKPATAASQPGLDPAAKSAAATKS